MVFGLPQLLTRWLPFSLAELVVVTLVVGVLVALGRAIRGWWRGSRPTWRGAVRLVLVLVGIGLAAADVFTLVWGLSYARPSVEERGVGPTG